MWDHLGNGFCLDVDFFFITIASLLVLLILSFKSYIYSKGFGYGVTVIPYHSCTKLLDPVMVRDPMIKCSYDIVPQLHHS